MTQEQMKNLVQKFRENVEKVLPDSENNRKRIKEFKELDNYIKEDARKVCYHFCPKMEIYEKISFSEGDLTERIIRYILDIDKMYIFDAKDITCEKF